MTEQGTDKPKRRRHGVRILSSVLGLLVVLLSATIALLPYAIERVTTHWLVQQGIDQAQIENVDFNPFTGTLFVRGLRAVTDNTTVLAAPEFGFTFEWRPLLDGELKVDRIHLRGLEILVSQAEHGVTVAGVLLGGPAAGAAPAGWRLKVDDWEVTDSVVTYRANGVDTIFRAEQWRIDNLSTEPDGKPARVRFEGSINHAPLTFDAELTPFAETPAWRGHVNLESLELGPLGPAFAAPFAELKGRVSAEGETTVEPAGEDGVRFDYLGTVALDEVNTRREAGDQAALDGFRWQGRFAVETGQTTHIDGKGDLRLGRLDAEVPEADLKTRLEALSGPLEFRLRSPAESGPGIGLTVSGKLAAENVEVAQPKAGVSVVNTAPTWSGKLSLESPEADDRPLRLDMDGELGAKRVTVAAAGEEVRVEHSGMAWTGRLALTEAATETRLTLDGTLGGEEVQVDLPGQGVHVRPSGLTWKGTLGLGVPEGEAPVTLTVEGKLEGRSVALRLPQQGLDLVQHGLDWSGRFALAGPESADLLSARGRLTGQRLELALTDPAFESAYESVEWEGLFRLTEGPDGAAPILRGRLTGGPWRVALTGAGVRVAGDGVRWREPESESAKERPALLRGDLGADALAVTRIDDGTRLFTSERVDFKDLMVDSVVRAEALGLGKLAVMPRPTEAEGADLVSATSARLEGPRFGEDGILSASLLEVRDITTTLTRNAEGALQVGPSDGTGAAAKGGDPSTTGETAGTTLPVRVERIRLAGENRLHFRDRSVDPAFETTLRLGRVEVDNLDLARADATTRIAVEGGIGEYTTLEVNGTVAPLAEPLRLDMKGRVRELDLPPLSPYGQKELGYHITRGHMDADAKLVIDNGKLDGKNKLTFRNLAVAPAANSKTQELVAQLKMPLGQALNMLRDKANNIELELPVSGDITEPKFDFGDAVQQALGKTVRFAAISYLKHALQPYGTLITMVEWAGKAADYVGAIRLDPIHFPPGETVLDEKARDYVDHIAKLMGERPELRVNLCGHAVPADRKALTPRATGGGTGDDAEQREASPAVDEQTLLDLARRRAEGVKGRLVEHHGIPTERVFICRPEIKQDQDAKPQVEPLV